MVGATSHHPSKRQEKQVGQKPRRTPTHPQPDKLGNPNAVPGRPKKTNTTIKQKETGGRLVWGSKHLGTSRNTLSGVRGSLAGYPANQIDDPSKRVVSFGFSLATGLQRQHLHPAEPSVDNCTFPIVDACDVCFLSVSCFGRRSAQFQPLPPDLARMPATHVTRVKRLVFRLRCFE